MLRIFLSLLTIIVVGALASRATLAAWSDTALSSGNSFAAGTLNLKVSDSDEADQDAATLTWNGTDMTPGGAGATATLNVKNVGNPGADHVHFAVSNVITPSVVLPGSLETDLITKHLQITSLSFDGVNVLGMVPDSNGNGYVDLDDFAQVAAPGIGASTGINRLALTDLNVNHPLVMTVALNSDSPDQNQGDAVAMTMTAVLHQADGQ